MPETDASYTAPDETPRDVTTTKAPFPWERFLLSLLFGVIGWFAFWFTIILAIGLWIFVAVSRDPHPEFKNIVAISAKYLAHCIAYVLMMREDKPFPLGPLPRASEG
ncbi:MAG: DUF4389 domain-containing protein [Alphaproteobacteria bacterium]|nr:DUF4389 domain-containing protein [Alphaproteobacteria bacterium]